MQKITAFFALSIACVANAALSETVELTDGRVLELNPDGTYEFLEEASQSQLDIEHLAPYFTHHADEYGRNSMRFMPIIKNMTGKEIVGFQFKATFSSAFGDEVYSFSGESSERIQDQAQSTSDVFYFFDDNQFISGEPYDRLQIFESSGTGTIVTVIEAVAFGDGSVWRDGSK